MVSVVHAVMVYVVMVHVGMVDAPETYQPPPGALTLVSAVHEGKHLGAVALRFCELLRTIYMMYTCACSLVVCVCVCVCVCAGRGQAVATPYHHLLLL